MPLLDELIAQNLIEATILAQLGTRSTQLTDIENIRQLSRKQLVEEEQLQPFFAKRYQIPLLSQASASPAPLAESVLCRHIYQETKVLLVSFGDQCGGIVSLHSDLFSLDKISYHFEAPLLWYWSTSRQIEALWQLSDHIEKQHSEMSVVELGDHILEKAIGQHCSDIHFEAGMDGFVVRFRVDGYLYDAMKFSTDMQAPLLSRIKILAGMDVAVKRLPQDGHYNYHAGNGEYYDLRVSSIPTEMGEKLVIRILDQTPVQYKLEVLGFLPEDLEILYKACQMDSGLILVVGPTGSGKTTTLYAMLNEMNSREKNIMTVEDPVEYHIPEINQISVQPEQNLTFAEALRAFLRQDPDIILVGEIRDEETAAIAIKAALTGHLVLATLHSVDAATTIQRLGNLGVDLNLLADTLKVVLSQRLVRRVCKHEKEKNSCLHCRGTGYAGRVPVYEILRVNRTISDRIKAGILGKDLTTPGTEVFFHSFEQTIQRLIEKKITDHNELKKIALDI
ncbi:MAG: type II/IV secretion system protein [SAR324 cluster bacterium]|nr:type II/IV secretion system protein [SAR324 cluster bacterium]